MGTSDQPPLVDIHSTQRPRSPKKVPLESPWNAAKTAAATRGKNIDKPESCLQRKHTQPFDWFYISDVANLDQTPIGHTTCVANESIHDNRHTSKKVDKQTNASERIQMFMVMEMTHDMLN